MKTDHYALLKLRMHESCSILSFYDDRVLTGFRTDTLMELKERADFDESVFKTKLGTIYWDTTTLDDNY